MFLQGEMPRDSFGLSHAIWSLLPKTEPFGRVMVMISWEQKAKQPRELKVESRPSSQEKVGQVAILRPWQTSRF